MKMEALTEDEQDIYDNVDTDVVQEKTVWLTSLVRVKIWCRPSSRSPMDAPVCFVCVVTARCVGGLCRLLVVFANCSRYSTPHRAPYMEESSPSAGRFFRDGGRPRTLPTKDFEPNEKVKSCIIDRSCQVREITYSENQKDRLKG